MSKETKIQWCDSTINPVMGCSGCELHTDERSVCYAAQLHRVRSTNPGFSPDFDSPKLFPGRTADASRWSDLAGSSRVDKPWLDGLPRMIFTSDMGDALSERGAIDNDNTPVAGGAVSFDYLKTEIVDVANSPHGARHRWLWLTKRPHRMAQFCRWLQKEHGLPLPTNIWPGTSIASRKTLGRISHLAKVGNAQTVRFLSVEPLWEGISLASRLSGISWVILGGESGKRDRAKPFECAWARSLRDECREANVPFFIKQLGVKVTDDGQPLRLADSHGGDWSEWPDALRVREMPKVVNQPPTIGTPLGRTEKTGLRLTVLNSLGT